MKRIPFLFFKTRFLSILLLLLAIMIGPAQAQTEITAVFDSFTSDNITAFELNRMAELNGDRLRLISSGTLNSYGNAWWKNKVTLKDSRSFSAYFVFQISSGTGSEQGGADGLTFTIQTASNTAGADGGGLGYEGITPSLGIEFDTYRNSEYADPSGNHIGIDLNGAVVSAKTFAMADNFINDNGLWHVWVDYDGLSNKLTIYTDPDPLSELNAPNRPATATGSYTVDLESYFGSDVYIGFTAANGAESATHEILKFKFNNDYVSGGLSGAGSYVQAGSDVVVTASPGALPIGQQSTVQARVLDSNTAPLSGRQVCFSATLGSLNPTCAATNSNGYATTYLSSSTVGGSIVNATATGGVYGTTAITFNPPGPSALNDSAYTTEDNAVTVYPLNNDSAGSGTLSLVSVGTPANGSTFISGVNTVSYTPPPNYYGIDTFGYVITNGTTQSSASVVVYITPVNDPPIITQGESRDLTISEDNDPQPFSLSLSAADPDNTTLSWRIKTPPGSGTAAVNADGDVSYTPYQNYNGSDSFVVQVSDGLAIDTFAVNLTIEPVDDNPLALDNRLSTYEEQAVTVNVLPNDSDPENSPLTIQIVGAPAHGATQLNGSLITYTPEHDFFGADSFFYTINDGNLTDDGRVAITVIDVNDPPVITEGISSTVTMSEDGAPTPFERILNATDVENNTLTWSVKSRPAHGSAKVSGTGATKIIGYTPAKNYYGPDSFTVQVSDGQYIDTHQITVTVEAVNDPPAARNDTVQTAEETALTITPLGNDTDAEGDPLAISYFSQPAHGAVITQAGNSFIYTPEDDFFGADSFNYGVDDGQSQGYAVVNIAVSNVNDPPLITEGATTTVTMSEDNAPTPFALTLNAADVDGDTLRWAIRTGAAHGSALPQNTTGITASFSYTPTENYFGPDSFIAQVSDGKIADLITVTITINAVNDPPVGRADNAQTDEETPVLITVLPNDSDPVEGSAVSLAGVTGPAHGTAIISGTQIYYTPNKDFFGTETFNYTLSDGEDTATAAIVVRVRNINDPPVIGVHETLTWEPVGDKGFSTGAATDIHSGLIP